MKNLLDLEKELGTEFNWGSDSADSNNVQNVTADKIRQHVASGYTIYIGNNPYMDTTAKWADHDCVRLAMVNSRNHGKCIRTIWAVRPA